MAKARIKKVYEGHTGSRPGATASWNYIINGKGDWGNLEDWNKEDSAIAASLAKYIKEVFENEIDIIFEGDVVSVFYMYDYDITAWKEDVDYCYKEWKKEVLPTL